MVADRDTIFSTLERHHVRIRGWGVRRLGLFGSVANDHADAASDLDFLVEFDQPRFDAYMDLKFFLEDNFHCPVDLVLAESIKPRLRDAILRQVCYAPGFQDLS